MIFVLAISQTALLCYIIPTDETRISKLRPHSVVQYDIYFLMSFTVVVVLIYVVVPSIARAKYKETVHKYNVEIIPRGITIENNTKDASSS